MTTQPPTGPRSRTEPLTTEEEALCREGLRNAPTVTDGVPWSLLQITTAEWADRCRRLLATLDAARQGDHYHGGHFHAGPCVGGVPGDRFDPNRLKGRAEGFGAALTAVEEALGAALYANPRLMSDGDELFDEIIETLVAVLAKLQEDEQ